MELNWANLVVAAVILLLYGIFMWKVWPLLKENAVVQRAMRIVYMMEEMYGGGTGPIKFENAVKLLQEWIDKRGWNLDLETIKAIVTAAVGQLHAEQNVIPLHEGIEQTGEAVVVTDGE